MKGPQRLHLFLSVALAVIVVIFVVFSSLYVFVISGVINDSKLEKEKKSLTEQKIAELKALGSEYTSLKANADLIAKALPKEKEASRLVSQIEGLFCGNNPRAGSCIVQSLTFGRTGSLPAGVSTVPIKDPNLSQSFAKGDLALFTFSISIRTSYLDMYNKLRDLENFSRYVHMSRIDISAPDANTMIINIEAYTFYQPEKIQAPVEEKPAEKTE